MNTSFNMTDETTVTLMLLAKCGPASRRIGVMSCGHRFAAALAMMAVLLGLGACGDKPGPPPDGPGGPRLVEFLTITPERLPLDVELSGRMAPTVIAEVRPQVTGLIKGRMFAEGSSVKEGALLYQIDPSVYRANFDNASASLEKTRAQASVAKLKAARTNELVAIKAVSQQDADDADAALRQANADVLSARAALQSAQIDLDHTRIVAPISGRIGRSSVTPGALVTANQPTSLATIQQLDPINVDVTMASPVLLKLKQLMAQGQVQPGDAKVRLLLGDDQTYDREGTLKFSEVTVEPGTSSVTLRAEFQNPDGLLLPGMYVRTVVEAGVVNHAILVPQRAVTRDPAGNPVAFVITAGNTLEPRTLVTPRAFGTRWLVTDGLRPGDRLAVKGFENVAKGAVVKPQPYRESPGEQSNDRSGTDPASGGADTSKPQTKS